MLSLPLNINQLKIELIIQKGDQICLCRQTNGTDGHTPAYVLPVCQLNHTDDFIRSIENQCKDAYGFHVKNVKPVGVAQFFPHFYDKYLPAAEPGNGRCVEKRIYTAQYDREVLRTFFRLSPQDYVCQWVTVPELLTNVKQHDEFDAFRALVLKMMTDPFPLSRNRNEAMM